MLISPINCIESIDFHLPIGDEGFINHHGKSHFALMMQEIQVYSHLRMRKHLYIKIYLQWIPLICPVFQPHLNISWDPAYRSLWPRDFSPEPAPPFPVARKGSLSTAGGRPRRIPEVIRGRVRHAPTGTGPFHSLSTIGVEPVSSPRPFRENDVYSSEWRLKSQEKNQKI